MSNDVPESNESSASAEMQDDSQEALSFADKEENGMEREDSYSTIGSFEGNDVGIAGNVIGSPESAKIYEAYYTHQGEYHTNRFSESESYMAMVDPHSIEGVHVRGYAGPHSSETIVVDEPDNFWGMHNGETHDRYLELTSHIPEINDMLEGKSPEEQEAMIRQLQNDEELGSCASLCYAPENRVKVWELDGIYDFDGQGRHRILAARENMEAARQEAEENGLPFDESRYMLPVQVIGSLERENQETLEPVSDAEEARTETAAEPVSAARSSREADMEEVLSNYRENLEAYGVSEEQIDAFVQSERSKMEREYADLDQGVEEPYIYHDPQNWSEVADTLKAGKEWEPEETAERDRENSLSAEDRTERADTEEMNASAPEKEAAEGEQEDRNASEAGSEERGRSESEGNAAVSDGHEGEHGHHETGGASSDYEADRDGIASESGTVHEGHADDPSYQAAPESESSSAENEKPENGTPGRTSETAYAHDTPETGNAGSETEKKDLGYEEPEMDLTPSESERSERAYSEPEMDMTPSEAARNELEYEETEMDLTPSESAEREFEYEEPEMDMTPSETAERGLEREEPEMDMTPSETAERGLEREEPEMNMTPSASEEKDMDHGLSADMGYENPHESDLSEDRDSGIREETEVPDYEEGAHSEQIGSEAGAGQEAGPEESVSEEQGISW